MRFSLIFICFSLFSTALASAKEQEPCATGRIISGSQCEYLNIEFVLTGCPNEPLSKQGASIRGCDTESPVAFVDTTKSHYHASLTKVSADGSDSWRLGPVLTGQETSKKNEKKDKKEKKIVEATKQRQSTPAETQKKTESAPPPAAPAVPVASAPTQTATPPSSLSVKGHFRARVENRNASAYVSGLNTNAIVRIRPEVTFQPNISTDIIFEPQFAKTYGEVRYVGSSTSANAATATSGGTYDTELSVHQAYLLYHAAPIWDVYIGRKVLSYGDELVIGALDWNNTGRSFDLMRSRTNYSFGWSDIFVTRTTNNNTTTSMADDDHFYGVYNHFALPFINELEPYWLYLAKRSTVPGTNIATYGLRAKTKIKDVDARAEFDRQYGGTPGHDAYQIDTELGLNFDLPLKRIGFEYYMAGKDYNLLYPTTHKFLGYADIIGQRNTQALIAHVSTAISESTKFNVDYYSFQRASYDGPAYQKNGTTAIGTITTSPSKRLGYEIDATMKIKLQKSLTLEPGFAHFGPGAFLQALTESTQRVSFAYLQLLAEF